MAYRIAFKRSVGRDLKRLGKAEAARILERLESDLSETADVCPELKGKFAGLRKFLVGDYRVVFAILGESVVVTRIAHRKDVYRS